MNRLSNQKYQAKLDLLKLEQELFQASCSGQPWYITDQRRYEYENAKTEEKKNCSLLN
ncbi:MAG: hypothetical protein Q8Q23_06550 [bacterium]|nr:hypothetical protein [bacterium]